MSRLSPVGAHVVRPPNLCAVRANSRVINHGADGYIVVAPFPDPAPGVRRFAGAAEKGCS